MYLGLFEEPALEVVLEEKCDIESVKVRPGVIESHAHDPIWLPGLSSAGFLLGQHIPIMMALLDRERGRGH